MSLRCGETSTFRILNALDGLHDLRLIPMLTLKLRHRVVGEEAMVRVNVEDPTAVHAELADFDNRDMRNILACEKEAMPQRAIVRSSGEPSHTVEIDAKVP